MLHAIRHMRRPDPVPILPPGWFEVPGHGPVAWASRTYETVGGLRIIHSLDVLDDVQGPFLPLAKAAEYCGYARPRKELRRSGDDPGPAARR